MKRFTMKRITALLLAIIMTLSLCPVTAFATEGEPLADSEQVYVVEETTEPAVDDLEPVVEDEPAAPTEDDTETVADGTTEYASESVAVSVPLAAAVAETEHTHRVVLDYALQVDPVKIENTDTIPFILKNGAYYSNNHDHSSSSQLRIVATNDCSLTLHYGVSSESNYDKLYILHNNTQKAMISGIETGTEMTLTLVAGDVVVVKYTKDSSVSKNQDDGWVSLEYEQIVIWERSEVSADSLEPTCTEPVVCSECHAIVKEALGNHTFDAAGFCIVCAYDSNSTNKNMAVSLNGPHNVVPGNEVALTLNIPVMNLASLKATLEYDSSVLEYVGYESLQASWDVTFNKTYSSFDAWGFDNPLSTDTDVLLVTFRVKEDIPAGAALDITFTDVLGYNLIREFYLEDVSWSGTVASASLYGSSAVGIGETVTLTQSVTGNDITGMETMLVYDATMLDLVSYECFHDDWSVVRDGAKFTLVGTENPLDASADSIPVLEVTFRVKDTVTDKTALQASFTDTVLTDDSGDCSVNDTIWNATARNYEAQWGKATGTNKTGKPSSWTKGTLDEAMTYANGLASGTAYIQLIKDVKTTAPIQFNSGKTTILDLNGFDIDRELAAASSSGYVIKVAGGNLTLCDTSDNAATDPGKITGGYSSIDGGGVWVGSYQGNYGTFTMNSGAISGNKASHGGGVYVAGSCSFTMKGGVISENEAACGGGVQTSTSATFKMTGGTITENAARDDGGGVHILLTTATMSGGVISGNTATVDGGGAYISQSTFTLSGGSFSDNTAVNGGGLFIYDSDLTMSNASVTDNTATQKGGGAYVHSGTMTVSGKPVVNGNTADASASNVYLTSGKTITVKTLNSGANIGVTMADISGTFSSGGSSYATKGYFTSDSSGYAVVANGSNLALAKQLSISFNANGGEGTMDNQAVASGVATTLNANTFTHDNYYFTGWNTKADGTGTAYADGASITVTEPITLYAQWELATARWGLATGEKSDQMPTSWTNGPLTEAMTYANGLTSGTAYIQLLTDVNTTDALTFNSGKTTILDLNGYTIDRGLTEATSNGYVINVSGNFTLCDTSTTEVENQGKITGGYNSGNGGGVYVSGTFTMTGGAISGNTATDDDSSAESGGGVYVYYGTFIMTGGSISENAAYHGGGVYVYYGTFTMNGGTISENTAGESYGNGGGVNINYKGTFTMNGGTISKNTAYDGGGVYTSSSSSTFAMSGGTISGNSASGHGGGVSVVNGTFTMSGGIIKGNNAYGGGGVFTSSSHSTFTMSGGSITGNTASYSGGVYFSSGTMQISGSPVISGNVKNGTLNSETGLYGSGESGSVNNMYFYNSGSGNRTIAVVDALQDGAVIGVTSYTVPTNDSAVTIATGDGYTLTAGDAAKFVGDDGSFGALDSTNNAVQMKLAKANLSGAGVVAPGSEVTLLLNVSGAGIAGMEGMLEYNSDLLEYVRSRIAVYDWYLYERGTTFVMASEGVPVTSETSLMVVTFRVKDTVPADTQLNVSFKDFVLSDGTNDFNLGTVAWSGTVDNVSDNASLTGNNIVSAGSKVTLTFTLSGEELTSAEMLLDYDSGVLEYVSYRKLHDVWSVVKDGDKFTLTGETRPISSATDLLEVTFLVKRDVPSSALLSAAFTNITVSDGLTSNNVGTAYWRAAVNGTVEAQWGLATGDNSDQMPTTWIGSGTLMDAVYYANELTEGVAYIRLMEDVVNVSAPFEFSYKAEAILDLNGHDIDRGLTKAVYDGNVITISDGSLTICDTSTSDVKSQGKITGGYNRGRSSSVYGGGVYLYSGTFTMNGGRISGNHGTFGGGVHATRGTFVMNGGAISGNSAEVNTDGSLYRSGNGGGVAVESATFTMNGGTISENTSAMDGGGVNGTFTMNGGTISENSAYNGGGVYGSLTMKGGTISGNTARNGGGVYISGPFSMSGGTITGNNVTSVITDYGYSEGGYGGGVYGYNMEVWGTPVITGNVSNGTLNSATGLYENGAESNVYFYSSGGITVVAKLKDGAKIGISGSLSYNETSRIVVKGIDTAPAYTLTAADAAKFTSDNEMILEYKSVNNSVILKNPPEPTVKPSLGVTSGTLNLFEDSSLLVPVDWDYTMVSVEFVNWQTRNAFNLTMLGNGMLEITPRIDKPEYMTWAEWSKSMTGTYKSAIEVEFITGTYHTSKETLTLSLTATTPKVTAAAVKFNSFFADSTQKLVFTTGETVTGVALDKSMENPEWIAVNEDGTISLINEKLTNNKGSGTLNLDVWLEGYRAPAQVAVSVSAAYTAPKLKLKTSSVNLMSSSQYQEPVAMTLLSGDKTPFEAIGVTDLRVADMAELSEKDQKTYAASAYAYVAEYSEETGAFTLMTDGKPINGKVLLMATLDGAASEMSIPLTVKVVMPTLKASTTKATLNTAKGYDMGARDEMTVAFSGDVPAFWYNDVSYEITPPKNATVDMLSVVPDGDGTVTFYANEGIVDGSYKVNVTVGAAKPVAITVTAKATLPKLKLSKSSINLNTAMGDYADVQPVDVTDSDANYDFVLKQHEITAPAGLSVVVDENNQLSVSTAMDTKPGTYKVEIDHKMPGGQSVKSTLSVKVVQTLPTLKADNTTLSLDTTHGIATVNVSGLEGFTVGELVVDAPAGVAVEMVDGDSFTVKIEDAVALGTKGGKINVSFKLSETVQTKPVAITVKPVNSITATASIKGNMDVTRPVSTASNFTFKYTGWYPGAYADANYNPTLVWDVYALNGKTDLGKVASSETDGWFVDADDSAFGVSLKLNTEEGSAWDNGEINPKYTYTAKFKLVFDDGYEVPVKDVKMTVKQVTTKFAADVKAVDLYKQSDAVSDAFIINKTDKDAANVADIAKVAVAASKTPSAFEVIETDDGYVVVWKDGIVPSNAKSGTVKLNIWLEGNYEEGCEEIWDTKSPEYRKPNATVSLKVNVK